MPETVSQEKCKIVVDAMGGDFAPLNCILGAIDAQNTLASSEIYLVG
jgi:fatty acid/phospholipid biosynthesis enzyme